MVISSKGLNWCNSLDRVTQWSLVRGDSIGVIIGSDHWIEFPQARGFTNPLTFHGISRCESKIPRHPRLLKKKGPARNSFFPTP